MTMPLDEVRNITVQAPGEPLVITVNTPGPQGPPGIFRLGTITTTGPGSDASATVGTDPDGVQVINLSIPRGDTGAMGSFNIGTVTSGVSASATVTGTAGSQLLNLVLPKGDQGPAGPQGAQGIQGIQGPQGIPGTDGKDGAGITIAGEVATYADLPTNLTSTDSGKAYLNDADGKLYVWTGTSFPADGSGTVFVGPAGPANAITIGTVTTGAAGSQANASMSGTAPNQTLNLTIPTGAAGPANTLSIGTVTTGASGTNAVATITGSSPNQTLNLTIPVGPTGAPGPQGPAGPTGNGVLVLGATDPVPVNTSVNTVIYRPSVKTATFYWGSGVTLPGSGAGTGDTYFHTGLNCLMRFNGTAWRQTGPSSVADDNARLTMSTNYAAVLYPGFLVRVTATGGTFEWTGGKWALAWMNADAYTWHVIGAAGEVAFQNGWTNYASGFQTARYMKMPSGLVVVQGLVMSGTIGAAIFVLPVGYRPSATLLTAQETNANVAGRVDISPNGQIAAVAGSNAWISINASFPAEA